MKVLLGGVLSILLCASSVSAMDQGGRVVVRQGRLKEKVVVAVVALALFIAVKHGKDIHPALDKHNFVAMKTYMITAGALIITALNGLPREKASAMIFAAFIFCSNWVYERTYRAEGQASWTEYTVPALVIFVATTLMAFMLRRDDIIRVHRDA